MKMKNKTTKLRTHTSSKKGRKFRKEKSAILFFNNLQFVSKKNRNSLLCGQIYPLSLSPGGKVDISARRLLSLPAKLE